MAQKKKAAKGPSNKNLSKSEPEEKDNGTVVLLLSSKSTGKITVDSGKWKKVATMIKNISHPIRMQILQLLQQKDKMAVIEMFENLSASQSECSTHLRKMKDAGIVTFEERGTKNLYSINYPAIKHLNDFINGF